MNKNFWVALVAFALGVLTATLAHEGTEKNVLLHTTGEVTIDGTFKNREQCLNKLESIMAPGPQQARYQCVEAK